MIWDRFCRHLVNIGMARSFMHWYVKKSCPLGFPLELFYFMPSYSFVFLSHLVSGVGCGIRLYRFLSGAPLHESTLLCLQQMRHARAVFFLILVYSVWHVCSKLVNTIKKLGQWRNGAPVIVLPFPPFHFGIKMYLDAGIGLCTNLYKYTIRWYAQYWSGDTCKFTVVSVRVNYNIII